MNKWIVPAFLFVSVLAAVFLETSKLNKVMIGVWKGVSKDDLFEIKLE